MRIYVGNLPYGVTETELREAFSAHGDVSDAVVITDRFSGQSKGFGFVEMANQQEGEAAVNSMNGTDMDGRQIVVNEARPRAERNDGYRGGGGGGGGRSY